MLDILLMLFVVSPLYKNSLMTSFLLSVGLDVERVIKKRCNVSIKKTISVIKRPVMTKNWSLPWFLLNDFSSLQHLQDEYSFIEYNSGSTETRPKPLYH